jgi:SAM-dependent methyltransferase
MTTWQSNSAKIYISTYDDLSKSLKTDDELSFIKKHFTKRQDLIEFGCGSGRTMMPLLEAGYRISGLDFSKGMLQILKKKLRAKKLRTPVFEKNLVNFSLSKKFDGGILSQRTLNFITSPEGQRKALINIAKVLKKGAILIVNLMPARPEDFSQKQDKFKMTEVFINSTTGNKVELWEKWIPDPTKQTWDYTDKFIEKGKSKTTGMKMHVIFETEMKKLLELCGFKTVKICGDWKGKKYGAKSPHLIFIAKKTT